MTHTILEFRGISKSFFGSPALTNVGFALQSGSILGLVGENGAGKSTLMNILSGNLRADQGAMWLEGHAFAPKNVQMAAKAGIALVHQELNLFPNLSVAENLFLTRFPKASFGAVSGTRLLEQAKSALAAVGLQIWPGAKVEALSPGERQLVEIAKALIDTPRILVLDEPTTSLTNHETARLFGLLEHLQDEGVSIIYISHNLGDVLRLCDQIVVLRDGTVQAVESANVLTVDRMVRLMVGRELKALFPLRESHILKEAVLEVRDLSKPGFLHNIGFSVRRGELVGLTGLMGAGRTELARVLFGLETHSTGQIAIAGNPLTGSRPRDSVNRGLGFLTEDRRTEGLLMETGVEDNVALASWRRFGTVPLGWVRNGAVKLACGKVMKSLALRCRDPRRQEVRTLSGGNQQKVVLGKWLLNECEVLILDEPTRGVDVASRYDIYVEINRLLRQGAGILMISSELEELMGMSDRILVMARGEIRTEFKRDTFDQEAILRAAFGQERLQ